jgi:CBS domain-containing protein
MKVGDVMIQELVSLKPEDSIQEAAQLLRKSCASSLPVVDDSGAVVGVLAESDLISRLNVGRRSWWQAFTSDVTELAREYRVLHGITVAEVMSPAATLVSAGDPIEAAAAMLTQNGLRELPVVREGRLVGRISRSELLALLAEMPRRTRRARTDAELVAEMKNRLAAEAWVSRGHLWIEASNGVIRISGLVDTEEQRAAIGVMAHTIEGCVEVENSLITRSQLPRNSGVV